MSARPRHLRCWAHPWTPHFDLRNALVFSIGSPCHRATTAICSSDSRLTCEVFLMPLRGDAGSPDLRTRAALGSSFWLLSSSFCDLDSTRSFSRSRSMRSRARRSVSRRRRSECEKKDGLRRTCSRLTKGRPLVECEVCCLTRDTIEIFFGLILVRIPRARWTEGRKRNEFVSAVSGSRGFRRGARDDEVHRLAFLADESCCSHRAFLALAATSSAFSKNAESASMVSTSYSG